MPSSTLIVVLLPAPFRPRNAVIRLRPTERFSARTASLLPYDLVSPCVRITASFVIVFSRPRPRRADRKSTRLNSSHGYISYAVFCLKKKNLREARSVTMIRELGLMLLSMVRKTEAIRLGPTDAAAAAVCEAAVSRVGTGPCAMPRKD